MPAIDKAPPEELDSAFQAVQATQTPRGELNGIQANDLRRRNFSAEQLENGLDLGLPRVSQNSSPLLSIEDKMRYGLPSPPDSLASNSFENIFQPISPLSPLPSANLDPFSRNMGPKRMPASLLADPEGMKLMPTSPQQNDSYMDQSVILNQAPLPVPARNVRYSVPAVIPSPPETPTTGQAGQAITTDEPTRSTFSTGLENVPEEPELPSQDTKAQMTSPEPLLRHTNSFPATMTAAIQANTQHSPKQSPQQSPGRQLHSSRSMTFIQPSDTLGGSIGSIRRKRNDKRRSPVVTQTMPEDLDSSWEDDIDYCYEHAAEADCEFDWTNTSRFEEDSADEFDVEHDKSLAPPAPLTPNRKSQAHSSTSSQEQGRLQSAQSFGSFRWTGSVSDRDSVPELDPHSSDCGSTISAPTPADRVAFPRGDAVISHATHYMDDEPYLAEPSLLLPHDAKKHVVKDEEAYEDLLATYDSPDYPFQYRPASTIARMPPPPLHTRKLRGTASANELKTSYLSRRPFPPSPDPLEHAQRQSNRSSFITQAPASALSSPGFSVVRRKPVPPSLTSPQAARARSAFRGQAALPSIEAGSSAEPSPTELFSPGLPLQGHRSPPRSERRKVTFTLGNDTSDSAYSTDAEPTPLQERKTDPLPQWESPLPSPMSSKSDHRRVSSAMPLGRTEQRNSTYSLSLFPSPPLKSSARRRQRTSTMPSSLQSPA